MQGWFARPDQPEAVQSRHKLTARLAEEICKDVAVAIDGEKDVFCIDSKTAASVHDLQYLKDVRGNITTA